MFKTSLSKIRNILLAYLLIFGPSQALDKFFIGINFGRTFLDAQLRRDLAIHTNDKTTLGDKDIIAGIHIGYNNSIQGTPLFVGAEVGASYNKMVVTKEENTFPPFVHYLTRLRTNTSITGTLKFGLTIKDLLFYAKAGTSLTNWNFTFSELSDPRSKDKKIKRNKFGTTIGAGLDYILNENWIMGFEYTHTSYPNLKIMSIVGAFKVSPVIHNSVMRLTYVF